MMNLKMLLQILNEAQDRVENKALPLDVRLRSNETVSLCFTRAKAEGWELDNVKGRWVGKAA